MDGLRQRVEGFGVPLGLRLGHLALCALVAIDEPRHDVATDEGDDDES